MADYYYGINRGDTQNPQKVQVGTVSNGTDFELHVSTTHTPTKLDVLLAICAFEHFIQSNGVGTTTGPGVDLPQN